MRLFALGTFVAELSRAQADYDRLLRHALEFSHALLGSIPARELMVEGATRLLNVAGEGEIDRLRALMEALQEKQRIMRLLDCCDATQGVQIFIGAERPEARDLDISIVAAPYRRGDRMIGTLGVIGPTRMNYARVVSIVDFTAKLVSDYLNG